MLEASYELDVTEFELDTGHLLVDQQTRLRGRLDMLTKVFFTVVPAEFGYFQLERTSVNEREVTPEARNDGFSLGLELPPGSEWHIQFRFRLELGQVPQDWYGVGLDGDIVRLGNWFPILSTDFPYPSTADPAYTRMATFDVQFPLPDNVPFVATGIEVEREAQANGLIRYHYRAERVRDFALVVAPGHRIDRATSESGIEIELLSPATTTPSVRQQTLDAAALTLERLGELIGPYPYPVFRMAHAGQSLLGGIEYPMLVYLNLDIGSLERLVYHETAHQWFYNIIGTRPQRDPWIDEGAAQFLEGGIANGFEQQPSARPGGYPYPLDATDAELPSGAGIPGYDSIYLQGQAFFHTMLDTMGSDSFWAAMREVYRDFGFDIITPWDLLTTFQQNSPVDLRPLFDDVFRYDWIDQLPAPGN